MAESIFKACLIIEIIRPKDLPKVTGLSRTTIWRLEKNNQFVKKIRLSQNAIGYRRSDIERWIANREESGGQNA